MEISQEKINNINKLHRILKSSPRDLRNKLNPKNTATQKKRKLEEKIAWWKETLHNNKRHKTSNPDRESDDSEEPMQRPSIVDLNNLCSNISKSKLALCKASTDINSRSASILAIINEFILQTKKYILRLFPHEKKRVSDRRFHILVSLETKLAFISSEYEKTSKKMGRTLREVDLEIGKDLREYPRELEFSCGQVRTMREERCKKLKRLNEKVERSLRRVFDVWRKGDGSRKYVKVDRIEKWAGNKLVMLKNEVAEIEGAVESAESSLYIARI